MPQQDAIAHLETFGYCLIEDAIPAAQAVAMAEEILPTPPKPCEPRRFSGSGCRSVSNPFRCGEPR